MKGNRTWSVEQAEHGAMVAQAEQGAMAEQAIHGRPPWP